MDPAEFAAEERQSGVPAGKKRLRDVTRAAEIVLVLAAMGEMRGGAGPTAEEREMMAEARENLVRACEEFAPRDVFPRDAFGAVIGDMGLDQLKEQKAGFQLQKLSIIEKFSITKHKRFKTNSVAAAESLGTLHANITPPSDKPNHLAISSGRVQPASHFVHASKGNPTYLPTSLPYQLSPSEVRTPSHSGGLPTGVFGRDSSTPTVPKVDRPDFRPEPRLNGSSYASQINVHPSGNPTLQKSSHFPQQVQSTLSDKSRPDSKVLSHPLPKLEGLGSMSRVAPQASKPLPSGHFATMAQAVPGVNMTEVPSLSNPHIEIGRIVQKILQPQIPRHPIWNPPSRDYMNKSMPCQVCKVTMNEVENTLVCDACEKGYHVKCAESHNQKGVSKGEWHCFKCLSLSNGKSLPPKYGRVTRSMSAPKVSSNTPAAQSSAEKKMEKLGEKENQLKLIPNVSSALKSPTCSMGSKHTNLETELNLPNGRETQENVISSRSENKDGKHCSENCPDDAIRCSVSGCNSDYAVPSVKRAHEEKLVSEPKRQLLTKSSETGLNLLNHLQLQHNVQVVIPDKHGVLHGNLNAVIEHDEQGVVQYEPIDLYGDDVVGERSSSPLHVSDNVDWIGDVFQVVDEKIYYQSCCVDGIVYKLQDHAFFYLSNSNDKLTPSKLQGMWEDRRTRSKWVIANRCYFHNDLPEAVGCPFSPERNEVYESNHGITVMAGLIRGPCEVLPPAKYTEESQRRSRLGSLENDGLCPLFLCKWFFDERKGSFRDVSC